MDDLFTHPLWMMWKYAYPKEEDKVRKDVQDVDPKEAAFDNATDSVDRKASMTTQLEK